MISAIFILDLKGRIIVSRDYRGDISPKCAERFMAKINELEGDSKLTPVIYDDAGISYIYLTVRSVAHSCSGPCNCSLGPGGCHTSRQRNAGVEPLRAGSHADQRQRG